MEFDKLVKIRKYLHQNPELSHNEQITASFLIDKLEQTIPNEVIRQNDGYGFWVRYKHEKAEPVIAFRTDIDALPITEINDFEYKSINEGVAHKCGHDGHATSMLGFAHVVNDIKNSPVELVFQGAEETGMGAEQWLFDEAMQGFSPTKIFAYHNLPGFPLNSIIVRNRVFSAASIGVTVKLMGKTSHAGHPERGVSPALAVAEVIQQIERLPKSVAFTNFTLTTVVHAVLGEIAFGTAPGYAEVRATLRSFDNDDLKLMQRSVEEFVSHVANRYGLKSEVDYCEYFPATENNNACVDIVRKAAKTLGLKVVERDEPFRWSEDFAHFTLRFPGALFGIGAGENHPQLHNPDYDFPDEILPVAIGMYKEIYKLSIIG